MLLGFLHSRVLILLCSFLLVIQSSFAQIGALEDSVFTYRSLSMKGRTDSARLENNKAVYSLILKAFNEEGAMEYPFSKLNSISIKSLPDNKTSIVSWNLEMTDFTQHFYGFIARKIKGQVKIFELNNSEKVTTDWEKTSSEPDLWAGALYYNVIPAGIKDTYILLGWRGKDRLVSQKIMDVLYFDDNTPHFGLPIIQHGNSIKYRAVFTYPADSPFSLEYDEDNKRIVFDRLVPNEDRFVGNYAFYGPNSIFDAYKFEKKKWILTQDVIANMPQRVRKKMTPPPANR